MGPAFCSHLFEEGREPLSECLVVNLFRWLASCVALENGEMKLRRGHLPQVKAVALENCNAPLHTIR